MALIKCYECGKKISDAAPACPSCGAPATKAPDISIHQAAEDGNIEAVKQHLAAGADVNANTDTGWTPLCFAANKEIAELLITNGANVNAKEGYSFAPLHAAAYAGQKEIVELLIAEGADVNAKLGDGWTPLHFAANKEVAELLIVNGADVNAKDETGGTPLLAAARYGRKEVAKLLITAGADVNAKRDNGHTPLDMAENEKTADLLRKHGGKTGAELKAEGK